MKNLENNRFLKRVDKFNTRYNAITINDQVNSITLSFWSWEEIESGLTLREEWEVPLTLVPFQGDWHDLFCLDPDSGRIVAINDKREVIAQWENSREFESSLSKNEMVKEAEPKLIGVSLSPDLLKKANEFKKKL